ncbi:MAG: tetratricopeptide repeat protein [Thermodesulfovibrionales bacterium]|nr:tetratricopeptide repeat protein [Thermodesulfovibrionales bacterium]
MRVRSILIFLIFFLSSCATTGKENIEKANAHYRIGLSHFNENRIQMAYVEFQKALELNPDDKEVLNALGVVYLVFEDLQKARESFLKAVTLDPNFSEAHNNLGVTYGKMGRWSDTLNSFKSAIKNPLYQKPEIAYNGLGEAYYRLGRIDEAIDAYRESIKRMQDFYRPYYGLALCYNAKGQYGDAATAIKRAIELDPIFRGDRKKLIDDLKNKSLIAKGEEKKDIIDYLEILRY